MWQVCAVQFTWDVWILLFSSFPLWIRFLEAEYEFVDKFTALHLLRDGSLSLFALYNNLYCSLRNFVEHATKTDNTTKQPQHFSWKLLTRCVGKLQSNALLLPYEKESSVNGRRKFTKDFLMLMRFLRDFSTCDIIHLTDPQIGAEIIWCGPRWCVGDDVLSFCTEWKTVNRIKFARYLDYSSKNLN